MRLNNLRFLCGTAVFSLLHIMLTLNTVVYFLQDLVYQTCLETGDNGEDATTLFTNYPDLLGDW